MSDRAQLPDRFDEDLSREPDSDGGFPFPLAEPRPEPVMVTRPCGCTSMITEPGATPMQVSWCVPHDPGYEPPGAPEGETSE